MRPHEDGNHSEYEMYGENKMTNDLLPCLIRHKKRGTLYEPIGAATIQSETDLIDGDLVYLYRDIANGSLWARKHDEFFDGRFESVPDTRAPNKPAEVDLDSIKKDVRSYFNAFNDSYKSMLHNHGDDVIGYLATNGHLATGKGGGDLEHQLFCLKSDYKHLETHSRNQAEEHDATKRELAQAKLELARIRKAQPAAPTQIDEVPSAILFDENDPVSVEKTRQFINKCAMEVLRGSQIDAGDLERAVSEAKIITVYQGSTDNKIHPHDSVVVKSFGQARLILDAARAHLESMRDKNDQ